MTRVIKVENWFAKKELNESARYALETSGLNVIGETEKAYEVEYPCVLFQFGIEIALKDPSTLIKTARIAKTWIPKSLCEASEAEAETP